MRLGALSGVVRFLGGGLKVTRRTAVTFDADGLPVESAPIIVDMIASVQPMEGKERATLPEGFRDAEVVTVYSDKEMCTGGKPGGGAPDCFQWEGRTYETFGASLWDASAAHYKTLATLRDF